jgi:hypothetical protein
LRNLIRNHVVRVEIQADQLVVELKAAASSGPPSAVDNERPVVRIPWKKNANEAATGNHRAGLRLSTRPSTDTRRDPRDARRGDCARPALA